MSALGSGTPFQDHACVWLRRCQLAFSNCCELMRKEPVNKCCVFSKEQNGTSTHKSLHPSGSMVLCHSSQEIMFICYLYFLTLLWLKFYSGLYIPMNYKQSVDDCAYICTTIKYYTRKIIWVPLEWEFFPLNRNCVLFQYPENWYRSSLL